MNKKIDAEQYLNDLELVKVKQFVEDPVMMEAVKKVVLESLYFQGTLQKDFDPDPTKNIALLMASRAIQAGYTNEQLGEYTRATWLGINALEVGFDKLKSLSYLDTELAPKINEAR